MELKDKSLILIVVLLINTAVLGGALIFVTCEVRKIKRLAMKTLGLAQINNHDMCRTKVSILDKISDCKESILNSNVEAKEYLKECVVEEVPKTVFKYAFPAIQRRGTSKIN